MDLQPSQNNYNEGDMLQISESMSGFFSRMTVSNKTMKRIMRQDSNLNPYDGFRIGGIGSWATKEMRKELLRALTPQEIRIDNPVVGRYEGMLEIACHEILVIGVAGQENGSMTLGLSILEDHKPWGRKGDAHIDSDSGICTAKPGVFPKKARETLRVIEGLIDSNSFYKESEEEIKNLKEALQELKAMDISEESKHSLENVKLIQRNFSIELQEHIVEKIHNFLDVLKDKKYLQSFLGVVNFEGIFIKDLAKYRKDFRPLLKETESAKWKWEGIHTQRVRELKHVCNNLPKLAIPHDKNELVVYTDAMGSCAREKDHYRGSAL
ncbi:UNVERIFIED_CONTAM: hypothetical protein Scaly_0690100 [Sesamum calycinum]|uniref:Uncharacterized protein n=1 Tax=Sesamum calycinum TaxID=2727403 RepID=A0AAW2R6J7_9LAMI